MSPEPSLEESIRKNFLLGRIFDSVLIIVDKIFLLGVLIITAIVASQVIAYPDFVIQPGDTYVPFFINNTTNANQNLLNYDLTSKNTTIFAESHYFFFSTIKKQYRFPIFLNYSFVDEDQNKIGMIPGLEIKIDPSHRAIWADYDKANVTITINAGKIKPGEYNVQFRGRGGGGESLIVGQGAFQSVEIQSSGIEPIHRCTVTIVVHEQKAKKEINNIQLNSIR
jgi:hypothetical protein